MTTLAHTANDTAPLVKGGVYALGNFDGVHRGHQAVVKNTIEKARGMGVPARVLTLEPHPRSVFKPDIPPFRLTPPKVKNRLLRALGVEDVITLPFSREFSQMPATDFVEQILIEQLGAQHVVAGFDFVFGHDRIGDMKNLRKWLAPHNVSVTEVVPFRDTHGEVMSSSRTREALINGDPKTAEHILGRPWSITGIVQKGAQRGTHIGVPTANITMGEYLRPKYGVYAVQVQRGGENFSRPGVANVGVRPTVDGTTELLEAHLFNYHENLYGYEIDVQLIDFIRPEQAFADINALRAQIADDMAAAKQRLGV